MTEPSIRARAGDQIFYLLEHYGAGSSAAADIAEEIADELAALGLLKDEVE